MQEQEKKESLSAKNDWYVNLDQIPKESFGDSMGKMNDFSANSTTYSSSVNGVIPDKKPHW